MKNLRKNLVIMVVMVVIALAFMVKGVNANSFTLGLGGNTTSGNTTLLGNNTGAGTNGGNTTQNITTIKVNTVSDGEKDLPQTGENDIYIVTAIGVVAIAIGGIAYAKSKRYEM